MEYPHWNKLTIIQLYSSPITVSLKNLPRFIGNLITNYDIFSKLLNMLKIYLSKYIPSPKRKYDCMLPLCSPGKKKLGYPEIWYKLVTTETPNKMICFVSPGHILFPLHEKPSPYLPAFPLLTQTELFFLIFFGSYSPWNHFPTIFL